MTTPVFDDDEAERAKNGCQCDILHPTDDPLRAALDLLPCPFCGGEAERRNPDHPHGGMVNCKRCGAEAFGPKWNARAALAAAPQPAPAPADERASMIEVIWRVERDFKTRHGEASHPSSRAIADALLAAGWTRGGDAAGLREAARELCDRLDEFSIRDGDFEGMVRDYLKNVADAHIALGAALARPSAPETPDGD